MYGDAFRTWPVSPGSARLASLFRRTSKSAPQEISFDPFWRVCLQLLFFVRHFVPLSLVPYLVPSARSPSEDTWSNPFRCTGDLVSFFYAANRHFVNVCRGRRCSPIMSFRVCNDVADRTHANTEHYYQKYLRSSDNDKYDDFILKQ